MKVDFPTVLGIVAVSILCIFAASMMIFGNNMSSIETTDSSSKNNLERDAEILSEINRQAIIYQKNNDQEKFHEQVTLMEEKLKEIANDSLGMNIVTASVDLTDPVTGIGSHNFPFRNSSEIEISNTKEPFSICNISKKIPIHLKKFHDKQVFTMFSEKYSKYPTELYIMDERPGESLVHYGITVTSDDRLFHASVFFHVNTCTDEIQEVFLHLSCRDIKQNKMEQSWNKNDVIASLQLDEFCTIPLDPWRKSVHEYGERIQDKRLEIFDKPVEHDSFEKILEIDKERDRLSSLRYITGLIVNNGLENKITQMEIEKYNEKFGSLPDELLELLNRKNEN